MQHVMLIQSIKSKLHEPNVHEKQAVKHFYHKHFNAHLRETTRGAFSSLIIRIFGTLVGFCLSIMVARLLGAQGSGVYYLSASVLMIASTLGRLGFDNTIVRFIASHASLGEWHVVHLIYQKIIWLVTLASLAISASLFMSAHWLAYVLFEKPYMEFPLILVALAIVPFSLGLIHAEALRGLKKIAASQWIRTFLISFGSIILLVPFVRWWHTNGAVAAYLVATIITAVIAWFLWRQALKGVAKNSSTEIPEPNLLSNLFKSSWPLFGIAVTGLVIQHAATILLGISDSTESLGVFNTASRIAALLSFPLIAMISILAPKFAILHRHGKYQELAQLARQSSVLLTVLALPVAGGVYFSAEWILSLFGTEFSNGLWVLRILLVGVIIDASTGAVAEILMMTGHEKRCRNANFIGAAITLGLCTILIPLNGGIGAAIAMTLGISVKNILMVIVVKKQLGFWPVKLWPDN